MTWEKKSTSDMRVYLRPWLPWPSPFLVPSNYLWAYWAVGTTACCQWSTQGDVGLMHTRRPLWLGLTTASFALRDGAFISYSSKISGEEHTYLHTWPHMKHQSHTNTHGEDIAFNFSNIMLFLHVSVAELLQDNTFSLIESWQLHWLLNNSTYTVHMMKKVTTSKLVHRH